jgi:hypothetical protein
VGGGREEEKGGSHFGWRGRLNGQHEVGGICTERERKTRYVKAGREKEERDASSRPGKESRLLVQLRKPLDSGNTRVVSHFPRY